MDRITRIRIQNVRAIESLDLDLSRPLTVLIGENGSCKSTILECLELLRKAADPSFIEKFYSVHRGMPGLLRKGAEALTLGVRIEDDAGELNAVEYAFRLSTRDGTSVTIAHELLSVEPGEVVIERLPSGARLFDRSTLKAELTGQLDPGRLILSGFGFQPPHSAIGRMLAVLQKIEVHLGFDTLASWAARSYQRTETIRAHTLLFPAERLNLLGENLANAWSELMNRDEAHRERTLAIVRLGLGDRVDSVFVLPDHGGGYIYLALRFKGVPKPILSADLSDGQLAWLAIVALTRLNEGRSLMAIDEPDVHLHPHLVAGVVTLLQSLGVPVVITTHSDRILELLDDPAEAVRVCSLDELGRADVSRVDASELPKWLKHFGDFGRLRDAGYLDRVLQAAEPTGEAK